MAGNFAAHLTRDEMAYGAQERGLNWGSIRAPDELVDEGHLNDRGFWVEAPHPELDRSFKYPGPAGIYNGSPWRISRRAPLIGEHNEEIYCGELGLQRTELAYLADCLSEKMFAAVEMQSQDGGGSGWIARKQPRSVPAPP